MLYLPVLEISGFVCLYTQVIESFINWFIVCILASLCNVLIGVFRGLLRIILRNLFCVLCTLRMCFFRAAVHIWCLYMMTGLTKVLCSATLISFLSLLLGAMCGYILFSTGYARDILAWIAGDPSNLTV